MQKYRKLQSRKILHSRDLYNKFYEKTTFTLSNGK